MTFTHSVVEIVSAAGAKRSSWHRLDDGLWEGTVWLPGVDPDEEVLVAVEQLASGWRGNVNDETVRAAQLDELLRKLLQKIQRQAKPRGSNR